MEFKPFKDAVTLQFKSMEYKNLFRTDAGKDQLWETYLNSFPEGTNPIYKERTEHDCQCCRQFIRAVGNVVAIEDGELVSIWDIVPDGVDEGYVEVAKALGSLVKSYSLSNAFLHPEKTAGTHQNRQQLESGDVVTWNHFFMKLSDKFVTQGESLATKLGDFRSTRDVMFRSLSEITVDSLDTVLELIDQNSLYRGEENRFAVAEFKKLKKAFDKAKDKDLFCWERLDTPQSVARIRNTAIGTLLVDLSEGKELDASVGSFESKVAPTNYKRPTALITKGMIKKAQQKVEELGFTAALDRRYAVPDDITVNNVLFADREAKKQMGVFDELADEVAVSSKALKALDKVEEVPIDKFIENILPNATSVELMVENSHAGNFMSLVAPSDVDSKSMFKWDNNFSWAYAGEVADSMKERVKAAGGDVDGVLRYSIQWNDEGDNNDDLDAHCIEPNNNHIYFSSKGRRHPSSGRLDVDIISPGKKVAVENITWSNESQMPEGLYEMYVNNYSHRTGKSGFTAEIEYDGQVHSFSYPTQIRQGSNVRVALLKYTKAGGIEFIESLPSSTTSREIWGVATQQFRKVSMIMNSPNHWDDKATGNKHFFFMLEGCKQEGQARGFFNEFLTEDLRDHRKVFEVLGSKMKTDESEEQLSGLGFSSTQRNHVFCRVAGNFTRTIKLTF